MHVSPGVAIIAEVSATCCHGDVAPFEVQDEWKPLHTCRPAKRYGFQINFSPNPHESHLVKITATVKSYSFGQFQGYVQEDHCSSMHAMALGMNLHIS